MKKLLPVILLSARAGEEARIEGLSAGADDYLLKPFEFEELMARLRALGRRHTLLSSPFSHILRFEDLRLDLEKKLAFRSEKAIKLSAKEFSLLEYFMRNPGKAISRAELAEKIWDIKFETGTNVVEVYINMLRNKIDRDFSPKLLHTRIGLGYVLSKES